VPIDYDTPGGQVRLLIADVSDPPAQVFTDTQVDAFLALNVDNVRLAAAQALDVIAVNEALVLKVMTTLDVTTDGAKLADALRKQAAELRKQVADQVAADLDEEGGEFDIADLVVDGHTFSERLTHELARSSTTGGFDPEYF
jgi:hypothetical protein